MDTAGIRACTSGHVALFAMSSPISTIIMFSADRYTEISVSDIGQHTEMSEKNIIMIKLDGFFRTILKDIDLAMSFENIMLDAIFCKTHSSTNIFLHHAQSIQFYIII